MNNYHSQLIKTEWDLCPHCLPHILMCTNGLPGHAQNWSITSILNRHNIPLYVALSTHKGIWILRLFIHMRTLSISTSKMKFHYNIRIHFPMTKGSQWVACIEICKVALLIYSISCHTLWLSIHLAIKWMIKWTTLIIPNCYI